MAGNALNGSLWRGYTVASQVGLSIINFLRPFSFALRARLVWSFWDDTTYSAERERYPRLNFLACWVSAGLREIAMCATRFRHEDITSTRRRARENMDENNSIICVRDHWMRLRGTEEGWVYDYRANVCVVKPMSECEQTWKLTSVNIEFKIVFVQSHEWSSPISK